MSGLQARWRGVGAAEEVAGAKAKEEEARSLTSPIPESELEERTVTKHEQGHMIRETPGGWHCLECPARNEPGGAPGEKSILTVIREDRDRLEPELCRALEEVRALRKALERMVWLAEMEASGAGWATQAARVEILTAARAALESGPVKP